MEGVNLRYGETFIVHSTIHTRLQEREYPLYIKRILINDFSGHKTIKTLQDIKQY